MKSNPKPLRHPPFVGRAIKNHGDTLTREGAHALATTVTEAWRRAGYAITPVVMEGPTRTLAALNPGDRYVDRHYIVRTPELVNGLPPAHLRIVRMPAEGARL